MSDVFVRYTKVRKACHLVASVALGTREDLPSAARSLFFDAIDPRTGRTLPAGAIKQDRFFASSASWELLLCAAEEGHLRVGGKFELAGYMAFLWCFRAHLSATQEHPALERYLRWLLAWDGSVWQERVQARFGGLQFPLLLQRTSAGEAWKLPLEVVPQDIEYTFRVSPDHLEELLSYVDPRVFDGPLRQNQSGDDDKRAWRPYGAWAAAGLRRSSGLPVVLADSGSIPQNVRDAQLLAPHADRVDVLVDLSAATGDPGLLAQAVLGALVPFADQARAVPSARAAIRSIEALAKDPRDFRRWLMIAQPFSDELGREKDRYYQQYTKARAAGLAATIKFKRSKEAHRSVVEGLGSCLLGLIESNSSQVIFGISDMISGYGSALVSSLGGKAAVAAAEEVRMLVIQNMREAIDAYASRGSYIETA